MSDASAFYSKEKRYRAARYFLNIFSVSFLFSFVLPLVISYVLFLEIPFYYKMFLGYILRPAQLFRSFGLAKSYSSLFFISVYCSIIWGIVLTAISFAFLKISDKIAEIYSFKTHPR